MGTYNSTYSTTNSNGGGQPTFTVTLKLGGNGATSGTPEIVFNTLAELLAWGVDSKGDVNSNVNYPSPNYCPVDLNIPASSTQVPAQLTVGVAQTLPVPGVSYNYITNVLVEALVTGTLAPQSGCYIVVRWHSLSISFTDAAGNVTTNAGVSPDVYAYVGSYSLQNNTAAPQVTPFSMPLSFVLATPSTNFVNGLPVEVQVQGGLELVSTDPVLMNSGNGLNSTNLQAKISVWTQ